MSAVVVIPPGTRWYLPHPWYDIVHWGLLAVIVLLLLFFALLVLWAVVDR